MKVMSPADDDHGHHHNDGHIILLPRRRKYNIGKQGNSRQDEKNDSKGIDKGKQQPFRKAVFLFLAISLLPNFSRRRRTSSSSRPFSFRPYTEKSCSFSIPDASMRRTSALLFPGVLY